ncbi:hypothetical protein DVA67_006505 [Solirubrobacter sp. CPCC 204708]|uniref:Uncharacterized protein n=1 Tax=Solirubrobacter deserti TaxID=2282478 RepID=A0ABT4RCL6_9ACTN|nr:hypothetical protein [Solirubrobacter deserti]MBE2315619.1 hypothetical protein [Solirubrobacter deserti]MDA0136258.1 hypothetical protein [Solirubrobacter deserti]
MFEVALFAAPYLLVLGLLAVGRFPGEQAIVARRRPPAARPRPAAVRWTPAVEHPLASLQRTSHRLRGPPAFA